MTVFDQLASAYDRGMFPLELIFLRRLRRRIYPHVRGRILELGVGTGVNLPLYSTQATLVATDLSATMLGRACRRRTHARLCCVRANAEEIPFAARTFDYVTSSLLFCSVGDPGHVLEEIKRVLRPGGWLMALEHVRGQRWLARHATDVLAGPWLRLSENCHLNRETADAIQRSGLKLVCTTRHALDIVQILIARKV